MNSKWLPRGFGPLLLLLALVAAGCGSPAPAPSTAPSVHPAQVASTSGAPAPANAEQVAAVAAVRAYAQQLAPIVKIAAMPLQAGSQTAMVEVLYANNVRQMYIAQQDDAGQWSVVAANLA
ncbi:MAG: hypothetical protein ACRDF8_05695 [Chloroflexota bacterium]